jgi:integrase
MPRKTLEQVEMTDKWLRALKPPENGWIEHRDTEKGLTLRIHAGGTRTWYLLYRRHGERTVRRHRLGEYGDGEGKMKILAARQAARRMRAANDQGEVLSPRREPSRFEALTVARLAREYLARHASTLRWGPQVEQIVALHVLPALGARPAAELTRAEIRALLDDLARGREATENAAAIPPKPTTANRTLAVIRGMFNWAIGYDLLETNPCQAIRRPAVERQRERVLTGEEIRAFWRFCDARGALAFRALQMILATAQRPGEVVGMTWDELAVEEDWWVIPSERSKNRQPQRIPISPMAQALLDSLPRSGDHVFPAETGAALHLIESSLSHAVRRNLRARRKERGKAPTWVNLWGVQPFRPHDLRRTAATHMRQGGVARDVVKAILNHEPGDVTAVYDRYAYDREKIQALAWWAQRLEDILAGKIGEIIVLQTSA